MTQSMDNQLIHQLDKTAAIARIEPKEPPRLIEQWVKQEFLMCVKTNGIKFDTGQLHDLLKAELEQQGVPINIFFAKDAAWIIEGARGKAKVEEDRRPRVVATLQNSPYTDIQFIVGIDHFGNSNWADIQMMFIVQPEIIDVPPKPIAPQKSDATSLLPKEALIVLALIAGGLLFSGNIALGSLGFIGLAGVTYLFIKSNTDIKKAQERYQRDSSAYEHELADWEAKKEQIDLEQKDLEKYRLARSFKRDDFRVFHSVITRTTREILFEKLFDQGGVIEESFEETEDKDTVPSMAKQFDREEF
jgi:hypothetical protein